MMDFIKTRDDLFCFCADMIDEYLQEHKIYLDDDIITRFPRIMEVVFKDYDIARVLKRNHGR